MEKKKISFLISGRTRNILLTIDSFKECFFNDDCDIKLYMSFQKNSGYFEQDSIVEKTIKEKFKNHIEYFGWDDEEEIDKIRKENKFLSWARYDKKGVPIDVKNKNRMYQNFLDQYSRLKNILNIYKKYNRKEDILVRLRLDRINFKFKLNLSNFNNNYIYFSDTYNNNLFIKEFFFFGNKEIIFEIISDFYLFLKEEKLLRPESQMRKFLLKYNEKIKYFGKIRTIPVLHEKLENKLSKQFYRIYDIII